MSLVVGSGGKQHLVAWLALVLAMAGVLMTFREVRGFVLAARGGIDYSCFEETSRVKS